MLTHLAVSVWIRVFSLLALALVFHQPLAHAYDLALSSPCTSEVAFRQAVEQHLIVTELSPPSAAYEVSVEFSADESSAGQYAGVVRRSRPLNEPFVRHIHGPACASVAEALAIVVAVAENERDAEARSAEVEVPKQEPQQPPAADLGPRRQEFSPTESASIAFSGGADLNNMLGSWGTAPTLGLEFRRPGAQWFAGAGLSVRQLLPFGSVQREATDIDFSIGSACLALTPLQLQAGRRLVVTSELHMEAGQINASAPELSLSSETSELWLAAGGAVGGELKWGGTTFRLMGGLSWPLRRQLFFVGAGPSRLLVHQISGAHPFVRLAAAVDLIKL